MKIATIVLDNAIWDFRLPRPYGAAEDRLSRLVRVKKKLAIFH